MRAYTECLLLLFAATARAQVSVEVGRAAGHKRELVQQAPARAEDRADQGVALAHALGQAGHLRPAHPQHTARLLRQVPGQLVSSCCCCCCFVFPCLFFVGCVCGMPGMADGV